MNKNIDDNDIDIELDFDFTPIGLAIKKAREPPAIKAGLCRFYRGFRRFDCRLRSCLCGFNSLFGCLDRSLSSCFHRFFCISGCGLNHFLPLLSGLYQLRFCCLGNIGGRGTACSPVTDLQAVFLSMYLYIFASTFPISSLYPLSLTACFIRSGMLIVSFRRQQFLYFFPLPHGLWYWEFWQLF